MKREIISSSDMIGQTVYNLQNRNIGDIKDLMINPDNGKVAYAVLSFGGFLGIGDKYFAIPIEALGFNKELSTITLDIEKDKLEKAPSFDKNNWPLTYDPDFIDAVYNHYGYEQRHIISN